MEEIDNFALISSENHLANTTCPGSFYSVYLPDNIKPQNATVCEYIFEDKNDALRMLRKNKQARFKHFNEFQDAVKFAINGLEISNKNNSTKPNNNNDGVGEKISPFKGPKPQDLVKLRKAIEVGDREHVYKLIWENPRYLVSSGDTPSILQEGFRYNALHIAAKAKNAAIAEMILTTVSDVQFIKLLYGDDSGENAERRTEILLDLYLNTPDKGLNETPLHFAVKFGALEVVELLVSFPQCDKNLKNKFGQTPDMIVCDRCEKNKDTTIMKSKMISLLENNYYVPVLRAEDNSIPPTVGQPFSLVEPPVLNRDPLSPRMEIHAYAGPMDRKIADNFRKLWKTPPRTMKKQTDDLDLVVNLRHRDPDKGLERLGHKLANEYEVSWKEFWPFLGCFVDISSTEGLKMLENHLAGKYLLNDDIYRNSVLDLCEAFEKINLSDRSCEMEDNLRNDNGFCCYLCVEKTCEVFANRISSDLINNVSNDCNNTISILEYEIKHLESLISSYMDDFRFVNVNFRAVHSQLGFLISKKLDDRMLEILDNLLEFCTKGLDYFSSDDEENYKKEIKNCKPTTIQKQLVCLIRFIKSGFNETNENCNEIETEEDCMEAWKRAKECSCVFNIKKQKRSFRNSFKSKLSWKNEGISKKLNFNNTENELNISNGILMDSQKFQPDNSSDEEEFFTAPSTPVESDDEFSDVELNFDEMFIEGSHPSKTDNAVYKALLHSNCTLDPTEYPNVYKWRHNISLYPDVERENWTSSQNNQVTNFQSPNHTSTPVRSSIPETPPSKAWFRITGANSPKAILRK